MSLGYSHDLIRLHPDAQVTVKKWLKGCELDGLDVMPTCTERYPQEQGKLWRVNRTKEEHADMVQWLEDIGLSDMALVLADTPVQPEYVTKSGKRPRHTNAAPGLSFHQRFRLRGLSGALAVDFIVVNGGKMPGYDVDDWKETEKITRAGHIAEDVGLTWAGRWKSFPELVHVQYDEQGRLTAQGLALGHFA